MSNVRPLNASVPTPFNASDPARRETRPAPQDESASADPRVKICTRSRLLGASATAKLFTATSNALGSISYSSSALICTSPGFGPEGPTR
jgi:hypothetical protein